MLETDVSRRKFLASAGATATALLATGAARAQADYPVRPVRLIVPFPAGGATDILGRLVAQKLTEALGQQFVVENKPGAGGNIGAALAAQSPPDGYTLFMGSPGTHAVNAHLYDKPGYDGIKDFDPISLVVKAPNLMVVHPSLAVTIAGHPGRPTSVGPWIRSSGDSFPLPVYSSFESDPFALVPS